METIQQFVISKPEAAAAVGWCRACADQVSMITAEQVAAMIGVNSRAIYRAVESGELHFAESSEGFLLICLRSVSEIDWKKRLP